MLLARVESCVFALVGYEGHEALIFWEGFARGLDTALGEFLLSICELPHLQIHETQVKPHLVDKQFLLILLFLKLSILMAEFILALLLEVELLDSDGIAQLCTGLLVPLEVEENAETEHVVLDGFEDLAVGGEERWGLERELGGESGLGSGVGSGSRKLTFVRGVAGGRGFFYIDVAINVVDLD